MEDWRIYVILMIFVILAATLFVAIETWVKEYKTTSFLTGLIILILFHKETYNYIKEKLVKNVIDTQAKDEIELKTKIHDAIINIMNEMGKKTTIALSRKALWELKKEVK